MSDARQNSEGHGDPPKGKRSDIKIKNWPLNFTLTADRIAVFAFKCNLLYADLKSSLRSQIIVLGYFSLSLTIW